MVYEYRQWRLKGSLFLVMMPLMMGAMEQKEEMRIDGMNLMWASCNGHKEVVDKLIEKGANVHATNQGGWTALMFASSNGRKEIVDKLIEKGANIDAAAQGGWTALMGASSSGHKEIVDKLIEEGADPYIKNKGGKDCLDIADNKELKDYIVAKHRVYTKRCIEHLVAFLQKGGTKNGRYCDWSGNENNKKRTNDGLKKSEKCGPFPKDIALHIAQIRYGVTKDEWSEMCRLENEPSEINNTM